MGDPAAATRNVFVRSTLEKLVAERDVRKNKTLNNVCKLVLGTFLSLVQPNPPPPPPHLSWLQTMSRGVLQSNSNSTFPPSLLCAHTLSVCVGVAKTGPL